MKKCQKWIISLNIHTPLIESFLFKPPFRPLSPWNLKVVTTPLSSLQLDWCQSVYSLVELECLKGVFLLQYDMRGRLYRHGWFHFLRSLWVGNASWCYVIVIVLVISSYFREFDRLRDVSLQFQLGNLYIHVYSWGVVQSFSCLFKSISEEFVLRHI